MKDFMEMLKHTNALVTKADKDNEVVDIQITSCPIEKYNELKFTEKMPREKFTNRKVFVEAIRNIVERKLRNLILEDSENK